jgi:light-regulated signal transduction histidine kinase (bacteriophytochrome)
VEHRAVRPDGTQIYVLERGEIVVNEQEGEIRLIGTVQDITDRRIIEEKLEKLNTALTRSNEDLDQFAYAVSHDLQEPLRTIISHADLLMRKTGGESEEVREICAELRDSSVRMKTLITDLLTYSRVSHSPDQVFRPVDLTAVLKWTVMNLSAAIKESNAQVQFENLPRVMGDDTLLVQVFQNLIGNSIKFRAQDPPVIRITAEPQGSMWVISVQDNGLGIDAQHAERIFKLFKRLHGREFPGNGIGLGICKKIIERHGGQIWVESQPNRGANFRFTCPDAT